METVNDPTDLDELVTRILTPLRNERPAPPNSPWTQRDVVATELGDIAYWSAGSGSPVLLVHGWEASHSDLDAFVRPFLENGRRVIAPDLVAHGESGGATASLFDMARSLRAVADIAGPLEGVVAHSAGAPAAAMAVLGGMVAARIALVAPPQNYERFIRWAATELGVEPDVLVEAFVARGVDVTTLDLPRQAALQTIPALIVHSQDDRVTLFDGGRRVANAWPGSTFHAVDGLGHRRILRDPATVDAIVDFITGAKLFL